MVNGTERAYNVLVVDDEEDVPAMFKMRMRREIRQGRYVFHFAASGVEALQCLSANPEIDLIVTDINMPEMDGLKLLENVEGSGLNLRSVILSAYGNMGNIRAAMNLGAFDFVMKPVDFDDMRATMERSLRNLELWREASESHDKLLALNRDLEIAWRMQNSVLPREFPLLDEYGVFGFLEPARMVSGDFYDVIRLDGGRLGFLVADVSGKGVPAAMFMMSARTVVRGLAMAGLRPEEVLTEANEVLAADNELATFVTMVFGVLDPVDGSVVYANAGHDSPLLFGCGDCVEHDGTRGPALGLLPGLRYSASRVFLTSGRGMCVFTDGVTEAESPSGEMFGVGSVRRALSAADVAGLDAETVVRRVVGAVQDFAQGQHQSDDITCLALMRR